MSSSEEVEEIKEISDIIEEKDVVSVESVEESEEESEVESKPCVGICDCYRNDGKVICRFVDMNDGSKGIFAGNFPLPQPHQQEWLNLNVRNQVVLIANGEIYVKTYRTMFCHRGIKLRDLSEYPRTFTCVSEYLFRTRIDL